MTLPDFHHKHNNSNNNKTKIARAPNKNTHFKTDSLIAMFLF